MFQHRDKYEGYDFHRDEEMQYNASGKYSTHLYAEEAVRLIRERELMDDTDRKPFFLYLPFQALHAPMQVTKTYFSAEPAIQVPSKYLTMVKRDGVSQARLLVLAMLAALDEAVGQVNHCQLG